MANSKLRQPNPPPIVEQPGQTIMSQSDGKPLLFRPQCTNHVIDLLGLALFLLIHRGLAVTVTLNALTGSGNLTLTWHKVRYCVYITHTASDQHLWTFVSSQHHSFALIQNRMCSNIDPNHTIFFPFRMKHLFLFCLFFQHSCICVFIYTMNRLQPPQFP